LDDPEFTFRDDSDDNWFALWQSNLNIDLLARCGGINVLCLMSTAWDNQRSHRTPRQHARGSARTRVVTARSPVPPSGIGYQVGFDLAVSLAFTVSPVDLDQALLGALWCRA
jgi:hypothetical protein